MLRPLPRLVGQLRVDTLPGTPGRAWQCHPDEHREASRVALDHGVNHGVDHAAKSKITIGQSKANCSVTVLHEP
eukprot:15364984-Heterocapsa_arctica.AAC.1